MPWSQVVGQDRVLDALGRALASDRVAHAYLFHGPEGTGKRVAALAFAQALLCQRRGEAGLPDDNACGACPACTRAARLAHPDLHLFMPYPKAGTGEQDPLPDDYAARLQKTAEHPYVPADYRRLARIDGEGEPVKKQAEHRVGPMRDEVHHKLAYKPVEGGRVVGVLLDADHMRLEAANAFLKLLEEPPPRVTLVLTAERAERVLPTILSRCQPLRFDPLAPETLEAALVERAGVDPARAAFAARMADGSYSRALSLVGSDELAARRHLALRFLREAYALRPNRLLAVTEEVAALGRDALLRWLGLVLSWVRDFMLWGVAGAEAPLVNVDETEAVRRFAEALPHADLPAMARAVEQAAGLIESRNVHTGLVLNGLACALAEAMRGHGDGRLFTPLDEAVG